MELVGGTGDVTRIVCLGEAMLELSQMGEPGGASAEAAWRMGYGGDTLNTAIHLARFGHDVAYMTALGTDALSGDLVEKWQAQGVDCSLVLRHPTRQPGLYAIATDDAGERTFSYWRDTSAARALFEGGPVMGEALGEARAVVEGADLLSFSLISLAILPDAGREALLDLARNVRAKGGKVALDGNYRARLWEDVATARHWRDAAIAVADFGLPTLEDETQISGEATAEAVAAHWQGLGCGETVVKLGAQGCRLPDGTLLAPPQRLDPVDTSGAGDAFNAGYLAGRLRGIGPASSAAAGHAIAGWVIMRRGAIPDRDQGAPYGAPAAAAPSG
ncbi:sugar kinase [Novosphingobium profundi]|uniref:sugar kinase n=1 Tax=Novosphingobium profundi TaxID=1774954 RepID=UPI001CFCC016|nr:sugar kinase [Novosphingobium profundi]